MISPLTNWAAALAVNAFALGAYGIVITLYPA